MEQVMTHWTSKSADDFQHRIASDFIRFIEDAMTAEEVTQAELASRLGVTEGRVSQVLNNPGNLTLRKIVDYVRVLKRKVAIVGYDDGDGDNRHGPIRADIFAECWKHAGKPVDFFALDERCKAHSYSKPLIVQVFVRAGSSATTDADLPHIFARHAATNANCAVTP